MWHSSHTCTLCSPGCARQPWLNWLLAGWLKRPGGGVLPQTLHKSLGLGTRRVLDTIFGRPRIRSATGPRSTCQESRIGYLGDARRSAPPTVPDTSTHTRSHGEGRGLGWSSRHLAAAVSFARRSSSWPRGRRWGALGPERGSAPPMLTRDKSQKRYQTKSGSQMKSRGRMLFE